MNVIGNAVLVEELVELLVVDSMRPLDLAVQVWCPRSDVDVSDIQGVQMPVKPRLELGPIVGLHHENAEREASQHFVDKANRRALIAGVIDLQYSEARAVIDGCELI